MDGLFDKQISIYRNKQDTRGASVSLRQFLFSEKHKAEIEKLRSLEDENEQKRLKLLLPSATISGLFSYRDSLHLIEHSGFICIDLDGKDNPGMDVEKTKQQLAMCEEMAYIGLSVRGRGLFCVVPIAYPNKHEEHFLSLQADFKDMGLTIDPSCKDVCRMRFVSYDPYPFVNESAKVYTFTKRKPQPPIKHFSHNDSEKTVRQVYELCEQIQVYGLNITAGYQYWFQIGSSLASMGEDGREAFHIVSKAMWGADYDFPDAEKKYDNLLRTTHSYSVATFFYICKNCGLLRSQ